MRIHREIFSSGSIPFSSDPSLTISKTQTRHFLIPKQLQYEMRLPTTLLCTCTRATTSTLTPLASTSNLFTLPKFSRSIHAEASRDPKSRIPSPRGELESLSLKVEGSEVVWQK